MLSLKYISVVPQFSLTFSFPSLQGQYNELSEEEKQILGAMLHNENEILQGGQDDEVVLRAMTIEEKMEEIDFNKNQEKGLSINQEILEILKSFQLAIVF